MGGRGEGKKKKETLVKLSSNLPCPSVVRLLMN